MFFLHSLEKSSSLVARSVFAERVAMASLVRNANVPRWNLSSVTWKVTILIFGSVLRTPAAMKLCAVSVVVSPRFILDTIIWQAMKKVYSVNYIIQFLPGSQMVQWTFLVQYTPISVNRLPHFNSPCNYILC